MISPLAVVQSKSIGENVTIHEFVIVREGAVIGDNVVLHPYVFIGDGVVIGNGTEIFHGTVVGKEPKGAGATARKINFERRVKIGQECSLGPNAVIFYDVKIGDHTLIGDGASIREQCTVGSYCILSRCVSLNYNAHIGDRTKVMDLTHITGNCTIGNDVFISLHVSTTNDNAMGKRGFTEGDIAGPTVEDGATVGAGANLLPGVIVGANAVVGAGSVVTRNVAPNTLVMGIPARFVRRVNQDA